MQQIVTNIWKIMKKIFTKHMMHIIKFTLLTNFKKILVYSNIIDDSLDHDAVVTKYPSHIVPKMQE